MLQMETTVEMEKQTSYTYWCEVSKITDIHDRPKFGEIAKLAITYMCLTHGNATPERGFSENKAVLQHRESLEEETIVSLRMVKDFLKHYDDVTEFPITRRLLTLCLNSHQKYQEFLDMQRKDEENSQKKKLELAKKKQLNEQKIKIAEKVKEIDDLIKDENNRLKIAEDLVKDANKALVDLINSSKKVDKNALTKAQFVLQTGINRIDEINLKIRDLNTQKSDLLKK